MDNVVTMKRFLLLAFVVLQILDVITTMLFLSNGHGEGNPLVIRLMNLGGPWWWVIKLAVTLCIVTPVLAMGRTRYAAIMTGWYVVVVVNNLMLIA